VEAVAIAPRVSGARPNAHIVTADGRRGDGRSSHGSSGRRGRRGGRVRGRGGGRGRSVTARRGPDELAAKVTARASADGPANLGLGARTHTFVGASLRGILKCRAANAIGPRRTAADAAVHRTALHHNALIFAVEADGCGGAVIDARIGIVVLICATEVGGDYGVRRLQTGIQDQVLARRARVCRGYDLYDRASQRQGHEKWV